ncbi:MAG: hypothetical protein ACI4RP_04180 [Acutalibacteraceae bacterium]
MDIEIQNEVPNSDTIAAMKEYDAMKKRPEDYKKYSSFSDLLSEVTINVQNY